MSHLIIGTAGHVDHGKTSLIKALTGVDTDRLKEEKERGITIQLGFTYFQLEDGTKAGIVDVPGHEKFVRNMLAGVGGMDVVLLVIAADEGVMPQTKEHLNILQLLNVKKGIIVITKKDLVDNELMELVQEDIKGAIKNSFLEDAPMVLVSSQTGDGLDDLKTLISKVTKGLETRDIKDFFRLPIDRVFSLKGIGTVVTGTLKDGVIKVGDNCVIYPSESEVKVRQIHVHGQEVDMAYPGQRSAINITGLNKEEITMGDILTTKDYLKPFNKVNCQLNLLDDSPELENGTMVRFHWGTEETFGRVVLLDRDVLNPSESCYAQIRLESEVVVARGDYFVIRSMSPVDTIGGGIIFSSTSKRVPRNNQEIIKGFAINEKGELKHIVLEGIKGYGIRGVSPKELAIALQLKLQEVNDIILNLVNENLIVILGEDRNFIMDMGYYTKLADKIKIILHEYHKNFPLREGMDKEELRSKILGKFNVKVMGDLLKSLEKRNIIDISGLNVSLKDFRIRLNHKEELLVNKALSTLEETGFKTPSILELDLSKRIMEYLAQQGKVIVIGELIFHKTVFEQGVELVVSNLKDKPKGANLAELKDLLQTTRKYIVPILEYLDGMGITKRIGEVRILGVKGRGMVK